MNVDSGKLIDIMFDNKRQYHIPVYQRNYDWKKDNCHELFYDALNAHEKGKKHFLGTIVQVQQEEMAGIKHFVIIDGQQRFTTIYLLLKALYDKATNESSKETLRGLLFNESSMRDYNKDEKNKLKLKPIKSDNEQFMLLMSDKYEELDKSSNIYINYNYFLSLIDEEIKKDHTVEQIRKGLSLFEIAIINLKEPDDEPQVVFERINSTGEDLTLSDLIRNYLMMTDKNMDVLFEDYWLPMETTIGKNEINNYFLTYLIFKLGEVKKENAYQDFKKFVENEKKDHEEVLKDLKYYSKFYHAFIDQSNKEYSVEINNYLSAFKMLKQSTIYPLFFSFFNDFEQSIIDETTLANVLQFFLNYTIRRMIVGVQTNTLRGFYRSLYKRIFKDETKKHDYLNSIYNFMVTEIASTIDSVPNDTIFKEKLMTENIYKNGNLCKYTLKILENGISNSKEQVQIDSKITIEHIMPQNKENQWWRNEIGDNFELVYEKYLHTLGNLTLTGHNSELSDKTLNEKIDIIKEYSKFSVLNQDIIDKTEWNDKTIISRADRLSSLLINKYLKLPEIFGKKIQRDNKSHKVYDNMSFKGLKPSNFIFLGESVDVTSVRDMLTKFCNLLYQLEQEKFVDIASKDWRGPNSTQPFISYNKNSLRAAVEILNSGIFIEVNRSFDDTIKQIKYLIEEFGLSHDDFVFYINDDEKEEQ